MYCQKEPGKYPEYQIVAGKTFQFLAVTGQGNWRQ